MKPTIPALLLLAMASASSAKTADAPKLDAREAKDLAQALDGKTAGKPVSCVSTFRGNNLRAIGDHTLVYKISKKLTYRNDLQGACHGLRFGDMSIFHRHEKPTGQGRILFSMAKAVEPGTFDLEAMTGEEIPGVSFFLSLPGVNSIHAYDIMVDTAKRLATELQGEILDQQQQALTRQLIEHYRERVQEFERRRLMQRPITP